MAEVAGKCSLRMLELVSQQPPGDDQELRGRDKQRLYRRDR